MAANSIFPHALRRIADTSRKFGRAMSITSAPNIPTILKSLPEHRPLLPLLLSHGIPFRLATTCADRYDKCASELRSETETKLAPYLVNNRKNPPAVVYPLFLTNYIHALRDWAQSILNTALKCLKRSSVDLSDWDVTYPAPLWLPSPPGSCTKPACTKSENTCPLSSTSTPPYVFPTTYPPPLRPSRELSEVNWPRKPPASPTSPLAPTIDIDSLCTRFTRSLVIDGNPTRPSQGKTPIFSLPTLPQSSMSYHAKSPTRKPLHGHRSSTRQTRLAAPQETAKPRQMSPPPSFPSSVHRTRHPPRKLSTSTPYPSSRPSPAPTPDPPCPRSLKPIPRRISLANALNGNYLSGSSTPRSKRLESSSLADSTTLTPQYSPTSSTGPTTPPTFPLELLSEPFVVSCTPAQMDFMPSPGMFTDPFTELQLEYDHFFKGPLIPSDYAGLVLDCASDSFSQKTVSSFSADRAWALPNLLSSVSLAPLTCDPFATQIVAL